MMQTPWYLDYSHLVFWFFFFSTFVLVVWLFYIYSSLAYNIESRRPVRETRGFSRAQIGDTMTAVLPLTWSITMLAHASTHSANFDENTTATVFSFSVIAYQWGWNYYFPRDVVEVLTTAPSLVGHRRAVYLTGTDPYASLLASRRQEYYARLTGVSQLSAKHGKYVLNQFLLAALTGLKSPAEHAWLQIGLTLSANSGSRELGGAQAAEGAALATLSQDSRLLLLKDFNVVSSVLNLRLLSQYSPRTPLSGVSTHSTNLSSRGLTPSRLKSGTNAFRAHSTAFYVGNRLSGVYSHLASGSSLPAEFSVTTRRLSFVHALLFSASRGMRAPLSSILEGVSPQTSVENVVGGVSADNIGANLWLTRADSNAANTTHPWLEELSRMQLNAPLLPASSGQSGAASQVVIGASNLALPARLAAATAPSLRASEVKLSGIEWLAGETSHADVTHKRGYLDPLKLQQRYAYSGDDLAVSGGESQRLQSSDVSWLSPNSATEINNTSKASLRRLQVSLVSGLLSGLGQNSRVSCDPLIKGMGLDVSVAACSPGRVFSYMAADPSALRLLDKVAPVPGAVSLAGLDQALNVRQPSFPFNLLARRLATQSVLRPEYSSFSWSSLRGGASTPLLPFSKPQIGGYLGIRGFITPLSLAGAADSAALHQSLATIGGLVTFNLGEAGRLLLSSPRPSLVGCQGDLSSVSSGPSTAQDFYWGVAPQSLDGGTSLPLPQITTAKRVTVFLWSWGLGGETRDLDVEVALLTPFHLIASAKLIRLAFEALTFEREAGSSDSRDGLHAADAYRALILPLHQIMVGRFIRLELDMLLPDEGSSTASLRLKLLSYLRSLPIYNILAPSVSAALSRGLGLLDHMFTGLTCAPSYLYTALSSFVLSSFWSFFDSVEEVLFFIDLGLLYVLGLAPNPGAADIVAPEPVDLAFFFGGEPLAAKLRSVRVGTDGFTTLVWSPSWYCLPAWSAVSAGYTSPFAVLFWASTVEDLARPALVLASSGYLGGGDFEVAANRQPVELFGVLWGVVPHPTSKVSAIFADHLSYGSSSRAVRGSSSLVFFDSPLLVPADTHWLEGVSDVYPTRVADSASSDPIFLNSKDLRPLDRDIVLGSTQLFGWWSHWSWEVLSANLPWDRLSRSWASRRSVGGRVASIDADLSRQVELTDLSRERFDKNSVETILPHVQKYSPLPVFQEIALPSLDGGFGCSVYNQAAVLPAPHVDVDPAFMLYSSTPEINTSRRNDHDARYKVSWGPLVAASSAVSQGTVSSPQTLNWPKKSGPATLAAVSAETQRQLPLVSGVDLFSSLAASLPASNRLSSQPQPGALFSTSATAQLGVGLPTPNVQAAAAGLLGCLSVDVSAALPVSAISGLESTLSVTSPSASHGGDSTFVLPSSWTELWKFRINTQSDLHAKSSSSGSVGAGLEMLRLFSGLGEQQAAAELLSLQQGKLLGAVSGPLRLDNLSPGRLAGQSGVIGALAASSQPFSNSSPRTGYVPIQLGVGNMRRLRVTQGIYLPADLPIHGIFGSKDVIHSWAIPGLGVKIDCIPGYSSHRRLFFRWRGLFWGQCMEVCGRYHHWMPLLVRIVHKDVFILWCLTYLRLLTTANLNRTQTFSLESAQLAWEVASGVSSHRCDGGVREALAASLVGL